MNWLKYNEDFHNLRHEEEISIQITTNTYTTSRDSDGITEVLIYIDNSKGENIGYAKIVAFNLMIINNLFVTMDSYSSNTSWAEEIFEEYLLKKKIHLDQILNSIKIIQNCNPNIANSAPCVAYFEKIYVKPEYRRLGIGKFIFENYERFCARVGCFIIGTALVIEPQELDEGTQTFKVVNDLEIKLVLTNMTLNNGFIIVDKSYEKPLMYKEFNENAYHFHKFHQ